jgi:hypothetical protein
LKPCTVEVTDLLVAENCRPLEAVVLEERDLRGSGRCASYGAGHCEHLEIRFHASLLRCNVATPSVASMLLVEQRCRSMVSLSEVRAGVT